MKVPTLTGALVGLSLVGLAWVTPVELPPVWLGSELIGMKVVSKDGESLGKIEDLVVRPSGNSSYAVLSFGGWLGMNDKLFAMPWSVLRAVELDTTKKDSARTLVLPVVKERFKTAPGFDKRSWPNLANPDWAKDIDAFYSGDLNPDLKRPIEAAMRTTAITWKATELKGTKVSTSSGEKLGDVQELAIDTNGRVCYATVSVGGFLGMGDRVVAVPWDSFKFTTGGDKGEKKMITLATTKAQLEGAPEFNGDKEHCMEMCSPKWIGRVYDHFSCPVYWTPSVEPKPAGTPKN
ncbi:MAG: PRC-barrel domain-containing protein [Planctomycetes bacterium]|nr:PRC-barrel domain-containing protein [Planctomycetota bacterium]